MSRTTLAQPEILLPPTQDELPYDDGIPMETQRHKDQIEILINALVPWLEKIYQNQLRVSEYFWYDPFNSEDWEGFSLEGGIYQPIQANERGQRISRALQLTLVPWQGSFKGIPATWLRWATLDGDLLPLPEERAETAESVQRAAIPKLLEMGLTAEQVAEALSLSVEEVRQFAN